jgi:hypothetical protein
MVRVLISLVLIISSNVLIANSLSQTGSNLSACFNMNEVQLIGKQISALLQQEFCEEKIDPKTYVSISQNILSKVMTEAFLGASPPVNWQLLSDDIIKNCLKENDLCQKEAQNEFAACFKSRIPLIVLQFGPWLSEHCSQLNQSLIEQWSIRKAILEILIKENKTQNNPN